jgi:hypothetical protein
MLPSPVWERREETFDNLLKISLTSGCPYVILIPE